MGLLLRLLNAVLLLAALLQHGVVHAEAVAPAVAAAAAAAAALEAQSPGATAGAAVCSLNIQGFGTQAGIKSASLSCTGGSVKARIHELFQDIWGPSNNTIKGVTTSGFDAEAAGCAVNSGCLITICGESNAVFQSPSIEGVICHGDLCNLVTFLCISGGSTITIRQGTFSSNNLTPLAIYYAPASVLVDKCTVQGNDLSRLSSAPDGGGWSGGMSVYNATLRVQSSTVSGNIASGEATGAMYAGNGARLSIIGSRFVGNIARFGGAIFAERQTHVSIWSSRFESNEASIGGGAIWVKDAVMEVLPSVAGSGLGRTTFSNNTALQGDGGDVGADGESSLSIIGATLAASTAGRNGGSIYVLDNASLMLLHSNVTVAQAKTGTGGCLHMWKNATARLVNTVVSGCTALDGGGGIALFDNAGMELINSTISGNLGGTSDTQASGYGGGLAVVGPAWVLLQGSTIKDNHAQVAGGGMSLVDDASLYTRGPKPTMFYNNTAQKVGGGLRLAIQMHSGIAKADVDWALNLLKVEGNDAPTAPGLSVQATNITVVDRGNADNFITSDNRDGFLRVILNVSGAVGMPSDDNLLYALYDEGYNKKFSDTLPANGTILKEVAIRLKYPPGSYYVVFYTDFGKESAKADLKVNIVPCPPGHVTGGRDDTCNPCPVGLYSFSALSAQCSVCGANTECPGGDVIWPVKGWWHSAPHSTQMHRCFNPSACIGGAAAAAQNGTSHQKNATRGLLAVASNSTSADFKSSQCSAPYQGNLCGECKPGYGKVRSFLCRKCMSTGAIIVLYMLAVFAVVGIVKLLVWFSTSANKGGRTDLQTPIPAEMLRALVLHSQWLYIICSTVGIPWPSSLSYPMQVVGGIWSSTSGSSLGIDCILRHGRLPVSIQKVLLCLLMPLGVVCLVVGIDTTSRLLRPTNESRRQTHMVHNFASLVMSVVFMFLPAWVSTALSLFTCVPLDSPVEFPYQAAAVGAYWLEDLGEVCYSGSGYHKRWALGLGIPLTLLFCVALPGGAFVFMWYSRKKGKLGDRDFEKHYGFMYRLWREGVCWWEAVVLLQTVALVMVATFGFAMGAYYQCLVSTTVLAVIGLLLLGVRPFRCPAANKVAVLSICVLLFTSQAALSFLPYNNISPGPVYGNIMGVLIMLANLAFLLGTSVKLVRVMDWVFIKEVLTSPIKWANCFGDCVKDTMRIQSKEPKNKGSSVVSTIA